MDLSHIKTFDEFEALLRSFSNWGGDPVPYDAGGVACLLGALLDNIHRYGIDADFEEIPERLTPEQAATIRRIAAYL